MAKTKSRRKNNNNDDDDKPLYAKGYDGLKVETVKYKTNKQKLAAMAIQDNDITFLIGSAGTGKTFLPVHQAVLDLVDGEIDGIIITRPTVEAGATMGFLPGTADDKIAPYLIPIIDCFNDLIGEKATQELLDGGVIKFAPIQFLRGRTLKNKFIIVDEAQNATKDQLKLILTRMGENSICVVTADDKQIDIRHEDSCMNDLPLFYNVNGIGYVKFNDKDVMRSAAVKLVLSCYESKQQGNKEAI